MKLIRSLSELKIKVVKVSTIGARSLVTESAIVRFST